MADSTTNLDLLSASQAQKEVTANALFDAGSPPTLYGRRASTTTALTWGYYGGDVLIGGVHTSISNGTISLAANATNYIEVEPTTAAVSSNTTGFTAGRIPLYTVVTGTNTITSYTDHRIGLALNPRAVIVMSSDANRTLTQTEARADILDITSSESLTATRNIVLPQSRPKQWTVANLTSGGQALQFIGSSGAGVTVGNGKRAIIYADGTNIVRVTADI